jgi:copper oxidase (laccase) domain-containing protein
MVNDVIFYRHVFPSWLLAGTTLRKFGNIAQDDGKDKLSRKIKSKINLILTLNQIHSSKIINADNINNETKIHTGDGFYTSKAKTLVVIKTADCAPVIIVDIKSKKLLLLHAGRKGLEVGIIRKGIREMLGKGAYISNLRILIGSFIDSCCYSYNMKNSIYLQIVESNIMKEQFFFVGECTSCKNNKYFSHRQGDYERMGTFAMIR